MFGPKITTVFRSRWNAVFWSLGVLLTAYCSVPSQEGEANGGNADGATKAAVAIVGNLTGHARPTDQHPANPWAKSTDK